MLQLTIPEIILRLVLAMVMVAQLVLKDNIRIAQQGCALTF